MRIGLMAPPFIPVPPGAYGGTELFVAHLAKPVDTSELFAAVAKLAGGAKVRLKAARRSA